MSGEKPEVLGPYSLFHFLTPQLFRLIPGLAGKKIEEEKKVLG